MPSDRKVVRNGFDCHFSEDSHRYVVGNPENPFAELISCTTLVHQFVPEFDKAAVAKRVSAKTGESAETIIAGWDKAGADACAFGTKVHETCEDALLGRKPRNTPSNPDERAVMSVAWKKAKSILEASGAVLGVELMVFSPFLRIAGTIDLIVKDKSGTVWIMDWKTNKDLRKPAFNSEKMLAPVQTLENSTMNHYALQLSIYQFVLVKEGYLSPTSNIKRALIHLTATGAEVIQVPFLVQEAALALISIHATRWAKQREEDFPF